VQVTLGGFQLKSFPFFTGEICYIAPSVVSKALKSRPRPPHVA
jgi:hypothetical protein